jgi:hypothetical protein
MSDAAVFRKNEGLVRISGFVSIDSTDTRIRGMGVAVITAGISVRDRRSRQRPDEELTDAPAPSVSHAHL